jgi:Holliday junction resolvasome RuvABC endonuclease subunit
MRDLYAAFDPGTSYVGWCVAGLDTGEPTACGTWHLGTRKDPYIRLLCLTAQWLDWPYWGRIAAAAIEDQYISENMKTGLQLAAARGWIQAMLAIHGVTEVVLLNPTTVKYEFTGNPHASKVQMERTAELAISLTHIPANLRNHAADAVGIGHVGWRNWNQARLVAASEG